MATRLPSVRLPHGQQLFFLLTCPIFHSLHQHSHYFLHIWRLHQLCTMDLNRRVFLPPCFPRFPVRSSLFIRWNSDFQVEPFASRASPRHSSTDFRSKSSVNKGQRSTIIRLGFSAYSSVYFKTFQTSIDFWFLYISCFILLHSISWEFLWISCICSQHFHIFASSSFAAKADAFVFPNSASSASSKPSG